MVKRRAALKIGLVNAAALLTGASASHAQSQQDNRSEDQTTCHVFPSFAKLQEATNLRVGDTAQTPRGLYRIAPVSTRSIQQDSGSVTQSQKGTQNRVAPTMITITSSNVTAVMAQNGLVTSVAALEDDLRTYEDLLGPDAINDVANEQFVITTEEGFRYEITTATALNYDIATAGGVRLVALPDASGRLTARQFGIAGALDARGRLRKLIDAMKAGRTNHVLIDVDVNLPGPQHGLMIQADDVISPSTLEFLPNCRLLFKSDGRLPHNYLRVEGVTDLSLIRPQIVNTTTPEARHSLPGIFLKDCENCIVSHAHIERVCGAGLIMENSRRCNVQDSIVIGSLADGFHITNGQTGPSIECWTQNCIARDTGDDGFAVVSYQDGGADPCQRCGHLNFYSSQSASRGAALVGGDFCSFQGEVWRSREPGLIVYSDRTYNTYEVRNCNVDVVTQECGARQGAAGIEIGAGCAGITGNLVAVGSAHRGISIASVREPTQNIDVAANSQNSGGDGIYIENIEGLNLRSAQVNNCAHNGLVVLNARNVVISHLNLLAFGIADQANRGLVVDGCDHFHIGSGLLVAPIAQPEKPILMHNSSNGVVEAQQKVGANSNVQITASCQNVFYNGEMLRAVDRDFQLECQNFGARTSTELHGSSISTILIPEHDSLALPVAVPARIVNSTSAPVTIETTGSANLRGQQDVAAGEIVTLVQIRTNLWHIGRGS